MNVLNENCYLGKQFNFKQRIFAKKMLQIFLFQINFTINLPSMVNVVHLDWLYDCTLCMKVCDLLLSHMLDVKC